MSNMVVCPEPPAANAGREVFARGGNAVDAAVATAFAQGVTNPLLCGLGGTGLWHYYDAHRGQSLIMNSEVSIGSRPVPESWAQEFVGRSETIGRYILRSEANQVGHQSVMTPGFEGEEHVCVCATARQVQSKTGQHARASANLQRKEYADRFDALWGLDRVFAARRST